MGKTRINLANPYELAAVPEFDSPTVHTILRHRAEHGPISGPEELATILGVDLSETLVQCLDFSPAEEAATESAGG